MHLPVFTQGSAISSSFKTVYTLIIGFMSCFFYLLQSRTSDVSYEEQDDPDGGLERRSLSGDS